MYRIRPWLYVGKHKETLDRDLLNLYDIGAMLLLAYETEQPTITTLYLPIADGEPLDIEKLKQGIEFVRAQKVIGSNVLIACQMGLSRSVAYTTAVLKEEEGLRLDQAYTIIKQAHPQAMPHDKLFVSLIDYYQDGTPSWPPWW